MPRKRKYFPAEEKIGILRLHLIEKVPVSEICEDNGLQPTVFYRWQKTFFENGALAFQSKTGNGLRKTDLKILALEAKLQTNLKIT